MLVGFVGLWSGLRADLRLYGGCLAIFLATAWVNGSVPEHDWAAGDAFGTRRYSLVVPLMALGVARMLTLGRKTAQRWPLLAPAAAVVLLVAWNLGFVSHFRARKYPGAAPIERLAADQARALRRTMQDFMGAVAGSEGRSLAYKYFSAEYFYTDFNKSGAILLRSADESYLLATLGIPTRLDEPVEDVLLLDIAHERAFDVFNREEHRLLVGSEGRVGSGISRFDLRAYLTAPKDRPPEKGAHEAGAAREAEEIGW